MTFSAEATLVFFYWGHGLARLTKVAVKDRFTIKNHFNGMAMDGDLLMIPLAGLLEESTLGREHAVGAAMVLGRM